METTQEKLRGFEWVSKYDNTSDLSLPKRSTIASAGYDFLAIEDAVVPSITETLETTLVSTGVKAYMPASEFLLLANRSSSPRKRQLILPNGVGIIDSDYYNNEENEGEIFLQLMNFGKETQVIKRGERICQGIFMPYGVIDNEEKPEKSRNGGFGSTN